MSSGGHAIRTSLMTMIRMSLLKYQHFNHYKYIIHWQDIIEHDFFFVWVPCFSACVVNIITLHKCVEMLTHSYRNEFLLCYPNVANTQF